MATDERSISKGKEDSVAGQRTFGILVFAEPRVNPIIWTLTAEWRDPLSHLMGLKPWSVQTNDTRMMSEDGKRQLQDVSGDLQAQSR